MSNYPEPTIGAIIFNPQNKVLLCRSPKWNNTYVIPGGHIELGERMEEALRREVKEETGLDVFDIELIGLQESIFSDTFTGKKHFIFIDYLCRTHSSNVVLNDEADAFVWTALEDVQSYNLGGFTRHFFERYAERQKGKQWKTILYNYVQTESQ